jgi:erythromycin esterase-like protein
MSDHSTSLPDNIRRVAVALKPAAPDYDPLLEWISDARLVLLGEASHGTHEFYRDRAHITQRLIAEKHFTAVAVEADWPDAYRINRYVRGNSQDADAEEALRGFKRFPTWMWRNADVVDFVGWLRAYNDALVATERTGFYGLDLYSLSSSIEAVIRYLDKIDPDAARRARERYSCFEHFTQDTHAYGYAATAGLIESCENEVVAQLLELRRRAAEYAQRDGRVAEDEFFYAEQNARLAKNAEEYYRAMFRGRVSSWNLRDRHMVETLGALLTYFERRATPVKVVVWAHNSHLGDARATEMGEHGELNVGQLVRERFGSASRLIGFTTHSGTVTAASDWDAPAERKQVRPALGGSIERIFHDTGSSQFVLNLRNAAVPEGLASPRLERAIGVIYRPDTERESHYFHARLPEQFDAVIHIDHTRAVEPLERSAAWQKGEPAETYPSGL